MKLLILPVLTSVLVFSTAAIAKVETNNNNKPSHVQWKYDGDGGPENWGKIHSDYKVCDAGKFQSPIDLKSTIKADLPKLNINYKSVPLTILNNGHTIQVNYPKGSTMSVDNDIFNLLQFHFHTPSEHTIDGKAYDMELHFVHSTNEGKLGVLAVMIKEGKHNAAAQINWDHLPPKQTEPKVHASVTINGADLIPKQLSYFRLMGSLTTPPCSEGVNWHVLTTPIEFSASQIGKFKKIFAMNARPVQPANSRLIVIDN